MKKLDMNMKLKDYEGNEIKMPVEEGKDPKPLKLRTVCTNALMQVKDPNSLNAELKLDLHLLSLKLHKSEVVDLSLDECTLLKKHLGEDKIYSPLIAGQVIQMIEK